MKQILLLLAAMLFSCCSSDNEVMADEASPIEMTEGGQGKTLVVYYSYTGNCRAIVSTLTSQIEADVLEIEPAEEGLKYEANNYALGTQLLNAIKANPNDASSYPAIELADGRKARRTDCLEPFERHQRCGSRCPPAAA